MFNSINRLSLMAAAAVMGLVLLCGTVGIISAKMEASTLSDAREATRLTFVSMDADMNHDAIRGTAVRLVLALDPTSGIDRADARRQLGEQIETIKNDISEERKLAADDAGLIAKIDTLTAAVDTYTERAMAIAESTDRATSDRLLASFEESFRDVEKKMEAVTDDIVGNANEVEQRGDRTTANASFYTILVSAFCVLTVGLLAFLAKAKLITPLLQLTDVTSAIADGDNNRTIACLGRSDELGQMAAALEKLRESNLRKLELEASTERSRVEQVRTVEALGEALGALAEGKMTFRLNAPFPPSYEELRVNFNAAMDAFQAMLSDVSLAAECIRTGSAEIATASDDLSRRTEQQAASLEETAAAMDQITASVNDTARGAGTAMQSVTAAQGDAEEGGRVVGLAVSAMQDIEKSSREIANIITVIDGIAFQTNLLALNAGVEAARAGDAGKGFAVVANEVRALAQRSADAAKDIKELITQSWSQVETGVKLVSQTGAALDRIVERVGEITKLTGEISHAASEQAVSTQQVNSVVTDMDKMTQQNAAMVEESTAAARSLADEADKLAGLVQQFDLGGSAPRAQRSAPPAKARRSAPAPRVQGNLALKDDLDQDWNEF